MRGEDDGGRDEDDRVRDEDHRLRIKTGGEVRIMG